jgi:SAM-dependent methyltransferase
MGHTDRERQRLSLQASLINPFTDGLLIKAGITSGMRILDLGCGVGEVSLLAARLVAPHGSVHGIDIDQAALEQARSMLQSAGYNCATFELTDVNEHQPGQPYDAVIGRHILIHIADVPGVLRKAVSLVKPGGVLAFQEWDLSYYPRGYPEMPLAFSVGDMICEFFRRAMPRADIGTQLAHLMQDAGLTMPECRFDSIAACGPNADVCAWMVECLQSVLPRMNVVGLSIAPLGDIQTLKSRMLQEAAEVRGVNFSPPLIGVFARKP